MYTQQRRITATSTWVASTDLADIALLREGLITEIKIRANVTPSAALTAVQPDGLTRIIQNLKIEGDGGHSFYNFGGEQFGRLMSLLTAYYFGTPLISLQNAATAQITWILHPGSNPRNPYDTTAVIPAKNLAALVAKLTTTANSVIDDTVTLSSAIFNYQISQVMDMGVDINMKVPLGTSQTVTGDATYTGFGKIIDAPTGNWLRRIFILAQDETATRPIRKDDEITEVKLYSSKRTFIEANWEDLKTEWFKDARMAGYPFQVADTITGHQSIPDGLVVIDLRKMVGEDFSPMWGLNLKPPVQAGAVKLGLTIGAYTSGDDYLIYWDCLQDMPAAWAR